MRVAPLIRAARSNTGLIALLTVVGCGSTGMTMSWSVLALFAASLGADATTAGTLVAAFGLTRLAVNLPAGVISERFGRRPVMLTGLALTVIGAGAVPTIGSLGGLLACLLFIAAGFAVFITSGTAAVIDAGTPETRVRDMSWMQGGIMIGATIGPALAGLAAAAWGYAAPFLMQAAMAAAGILMLALAVAPVPQPGAGGRGEPGPRLAWLNATVLPPVLMTFGLSFVRLTASVMLIPLIAQRDLGAEIGAVTLLLSINALANLALLPFTAGMARRLGRRGLILGGCAVGLVGLGVLVAPGAMWQAWIASALIGAGTGVAFPTVTAYAADVTPRDRMGPVIGVMRSMTDIATIFGPFIVGLAIDRMGLGTAGGALTMLVVFALVMAVFAFASRGVRG